MSRTQLFDRLLLLTSLLEEDQARELAAVGLTRRPAHLLWLIQREGPLRQRDLADQMEITPRHVTTLVDELIESALVRRTPHPDDRRAVLVSLTDQGASLMASMVADHDQLSIALTEGWNDAEVDDLREHIEAIIGRFTALVERAAAAREAES